MKNKIIYLSDSEAILATQGSQTATRQGGEVYDEIVRQRD